MAEALGSKPGDELEIATDAGLRVCHINSVDNAGGFTVEVTTGMGIPTFAPHTVNLANGARVAGVEVSTGNPHFVIVVDNADFTVAGLPWQPSARRFACIPISPDQTNVEFVRVVSPNEIEIRIFERGVGPTTSSGTGSSASATAAIALGLGQVSAECGCSRRRADRGMGGAGHRIEAHRPGGSDCPRRGVVHMTRQMPSRFHSRSCRLPSEAARASA